ncbi:MAG: DUF1549 domain-containing protein [Verrucomicrobiales bacterium]
MRLGFHHLELQPAFVILGLAILPGIARLSAMEVDFVHQIVPIIREHCAECHTGAKKKGGLAMNTRSEFLKGSENGRVVEPGKSGKSLMMELLLSSDDEQWMPPKGDRVPPGQIALLKTWIDSGMEWQPGFSFSSAAWEPRLKPRGVVLPTARKNREHPVDRLLDAYLSEHKVTLPVPAGDAAFLRRASLDVTGLLPVPRDLETFLADESPDKRGKVIEALLADDIAYADHWLTMWNDLLRNDYTGTGFITGGRKRITPWLYAALRSNKPYDQFVRELIAPGRESAGFIEGIKWRGEVNASQSTEIQFSQNISQVFLGINMKCASCHDSFIDRWTLEEAYNLAAIYSSRPLELTRCDKPTGKMAAPRWIFPELGNIDPKVSRDERLKQLAVLMTHKDNGRFTRTVVNRIWHRLMGHGIVHPVDAMHTKPWNEDLLDYLAVHFAGDGYDLKRLIRFIMTSRAYQSQTVILKSEPGEDYIYTGPLAKRMTAEQLLDAIWQITGKSPAGAEAKVDRVRREPIPAPPATPKQAVVDIPITAKWIWRSGPVEAKIDLHREFILKGVPKTARMMVTCDNAFTMKINGAVVASSKDWQQTVYKDIASYLLTGNNVIEVSAEMFGGSAGFICQVDGDKAMLIATDKQWRARKPGGEWSAAAELQPHGAAPWQVVFKRGGAAQETKPGLPSPPVRAALVKNDFLMRSLGRPHRDQVVSTRPSELTTLQAIDLSNGDILAGHLGLGARQLVGLGKSGEELIRWLYRYALSREPTGGEKNVLLEVTGDGRNPVAVEDLLWLVFMQPEFQFIR